MPLGNADFLIPRRRHAGLDNPTPEQAREASAYLDGRHTLLGSSYEEPTWTLGSTIKWIAERTRDVVDGLSVDEEAAQNAAAELQNALECGEVRASAVTATNAVHQRLPPETWSTYQVCLEDDGNLLWPRVLHDLTEQEDLQHVRFARDEVLSRWPPHDVPVSVPPSTAGKESSCQSWLSRLMRETPEKPRPKDAVWVEASAKFPGLSKRGFDRAWTNAIKDTQALAWRSPGRRS